MAHLSLVMDTSSLLIRLLHQTIWLKPNGRGPRRLWLASASQRPRVSATLYIDVIVVLISHYATCGGGLLLWVQDNALRGALQEHYYGFILWISCV